MNFAGQLICKLGNPTLEMIALFLVQATIGFIFGMSLVYMFRHHEGQWSRYLVLALMAAFYVSVWLLTDYDFARRLIHLFVLLHITMVGFIILSRERKYRATHLAKQLDKS